MGIKTKIKHLLAHKEYYPIVHPVISSEEFAGKVILISGGSGGIGLAIAKSLHENGGEVIIAGTNKAKLDAIHNETGLKIIIMDYSKPENFDMVIKDIAKEYGRLDIFISSVGVHTENVDFWTMDPDEFDRVMDINLKGTFFACQAVGKYMKEHEMKGSILLISSSRGSEPAWSPYGISKWGLKGLTEGVANAYTIWH